MALVATREKEKERELTREEKKGSRGKKKSKERLSTGLDSCRQGRRTQMTAAHGRSSRTAMEFLVPARSLTDMEGLDYLTSWSGVVMASGPSSDAASEQVVDIINDVLSNLGGAKKTAEANQLAPSVDDVPLQLLLEDEHKRNKLEAFQRKKASHLLKGPNVSKTDDLAEGDVAHASDNLIGPVKKKFKRTAMRKHLVGEVTPRRSPRVSEVASPSVGEIPKISGQAAGVTPRRSPRVVGFVKPSFEVGSGVSGKGKRCGVKCKGGLAKFNKGCKKHSLVNADRQDDDDFDAHDEDDDDDDVDQLVLVKRPLRRNRGTKTMEGVVEGGDDAKRFNKMVDSNISCPLMVQIYTKIDPSTMILDMGEPNKKLCITSDIVHHLFGFPQGDSTPPRPSEDGYDDIVMRLKA
ncbi:hypothetical protein ZWY2020_006153 [Hordeum vulgare]|nr:hypothetical protein ZWY2020_006153 [Hordeum vulgare]